MQRSITMPRRGVKRPAASKASSAAKRMRSSSSFNTRTLAIPRISTLSNSGGLRTIKTISSQGLIQVIPTSGFSISGLSASAVIGLYFTQTGYTVYNTTVGPNTGVSFTWGNAAGNYQNIFDQFRINKVHVKGYFSNNTSNVSSVTTSIPLFYSACDFDGSNSPPTNTGGVLGYENSAVHQQNADGKPCIDRVLVPRVVNNLTGNLVTANQYGLMPARSWIDLGSQNCPHWGMYIGFDAQATTQTSSIGALTLIVTIDYEYRGLGR